MNVPVSDIGGRSVFDAVNKERAAAGQRPLSPDKVLVQAAQMKADEMEKLNYFAHKSPSGENVWGLVRKANGKGFTVLGNNLAMDFKDTASLRNAWMASKTHKDNILYPGYTRTGIGISRSGKYVVQFFGK